MENFRNFCGLVLCGVPSPDRRPRWPKQVVDLVWMKSNGRCHHCRTSLSRRDPESQRRTWHVDHHPIPYRLIKDQCCCGTTDPVYDIDNLVASCAACNVSHRHETGRQPIRCHRPTWVRIVRCLVLVAAATAAAAVSRMIP